MTEQDDFPRCGKCGKTPADHLGWEQGHLFIRRMNHQTTTPPAEVQPSGAGATAAPDPRTDPQVWVEHRWAELAAMSSHEVDTIYRSATGTEAPPEWIKAQVIGAILDHEWAARTRPRAVFHNTPTPPETEDDPEPVTVRCRAGHLWDEECPDCP